jgi:alkylation response protein AidB-like acyl-CoA dehydrogenase
MDFSIDTTTQQLTTAFADFCRREIAPHAAAIDREGTIPRSHWEGLRNIGYLHGLYTDDLRALSPLWLARSMMDEELAKACASTFLSVGAHAGLCGAPMCLFGNEEQRQQWLQPLLNLDVIGCFALTEPGAGTDAARIQLTAQKTPTGWRLDGEKALITNAPIADVAIVMARSDHTAKGWHGVSMFVVDLHSKGVEKTAPYRKHGLCGSSTGGLRFDGVLVPHSSLLGEEGMGFLQAMKTLAMGRLAMCSFGIGIAESAYDSARRYATDRQAFGRPIARLQAVHFKIADMKVEIDGARLLARRAAWLYATGQEDQALTSAAKLYATEMAERVTREALQIHGGWGYTDDYAVDRLSRDARLGTIGEGTSEIQRELIARSLLDEGA